jgi:TolB protein
MYKYFLNFAKLTLVIFISSSLQSCDILNNSEPESGIYDIYPAWSPDGRSIAYISGATIDIVGIYAIDIFWTNKRIISVPDFASTPDWSPDGKWIVYSRDGQIFKKMVDDTLTIQLTFNDENHFPSWSSDGEWIAYDSNSDSPNGMRFIWKMRPDGSEKKRIIYTPTIGEVRMPDWFPDGVRLAVICNPGTVSPEIGIIDTMGSDIVVLTNDDRFDRYPKVSNDGNYIVYESDGNGGIITIIKTDGTQQTHITNGIYPCWSPYGDRIAFTNSTGDGKIWSIKRNGFGKRRISN